MKNVLLALTVILFTSNAFAQNCQNDTIPPTIECVFSLAADTCGFGQVSISAKEFLVFSYDDCTDSTELNFSFTIDPIDTIATFTSSSDSVSIWVTDAAGNKSLCNSRLNIVTNSCQCEEDFEITATIQPGCQGSFTLGSITLDFIDWQNFSDYTYRWSTGDTNTNGIQRLSPGKYSVTLTDELGCSYTQEFDVPHAVQFDKFTFPSCNNDGTALIVIDEESRYDFTWSTGETSAGITGLVSGTYGVTVGSGGCLRIDSIEVESTIDVNIDVTYNCEGTGNIEITPQNDTSDLLYRWNNNATTSSLNDLETGIYTVSIVDRDGCLRVEQIEVEEYRPLEIVRIRTEDNCDGTGNIYPTVRGGESPYSFRWEGSDGTIRAGENLLSNIGVQYFLEVEDSVGCVVSTDTLILPNIAPNFDVEIETITNCEENTIDVRALIFENGELKEDVSDYNFYWPRFGDTTQILTDLNFNTRQFMDYRVNVANRNECEETRYKRMGWGEETENCHFKGLSGIFFLDQNGNCQYDSSVFSFEPWLPFPEIEVALVKDTLLDEDLVILENDFKSGYTEGAQISWGKYGGGIYHIRFNVQKPYPLDYKFMKISTDFPNSCSYKYIPIDTFLVGDTSLVDFDIPIQLNENCELLTVDISTPFLRRCFESTYYVNYCNLSTVEIENAYIEVQLDDFLDFASSDLEAIDLGNNLYRFDLGTLEAGECGHFPIKVEVSCDAVLGQTHCTSANIFPIPDCLDWSGAELQITAECEADSVLFTIENIGEEDMLTPSSYIAIEDVVMFSQGGFELARQEKIQFRFPQNGSTYRLSAQQADGLPYPSQPTMALEGCGTNDAGDFSRGFVTQFPEDDAAIFRAIHCEENRGAYDPNDKQVFPKGVGALGQIEQNVDLEYKIRFQNTGTDTAFTVVILDTLDAQLDVSSVQAGASSHPYIFEVIGDNVLRFQFNNILLPDSTTNLAASQGFVQFRVSQNADVPLGETILNDAAIYFDFNEPIITNTVSNQIGTDFLEIISNTSEPTGKFKVQVSPNPLDQSAIIEIEGQSLTNATFILYDFRGREVRRQRVSENKFHFYRKNLVAGGYFFKIVRHKDVFHTGKLVLTD
ncbi:MAG: hypothetical protein AAGG68_05085 [Bacteroidota bacterium]